MRCHEAVADLIGIVNTSLIGAGGFNRESG
jgi:hypothetical protein